MPSPQFSIFSQPHPRLQCVGSHRHGFVHRLPEMTWPISILLWRAHTRVITRPTFARSNPAQKESLQGPVDFPSLLFPTISPPSRSLPPPLKRVPTGFLGIHQAFLKICACQRASQLILHSTFLLFAPGAAINVLYSQRRLDQDSWYPQCPSRRKILLDSALILHCPSHRPVLRQCFFPFQYVDQGQSPQDFRYSSCKLFRRFLVFQDAQPRKTSVPSILHSLCGRSPYIPLLTTRQATGKYGQQPRSHYSYLKQMS